MPRNPRYIPNLAGRVDPQVDDAIRKLYVLFHDQFDRLNAIKDPPPQISIVNIRKALQASGDVPLNVTGLLGSLSTPQAAAVPSSPTPPGPGSPFNQNGTVLVINGVLSRYDTSTNPAQWVPVTAVGTTTTGTHADRPDPTTLPDGTTYFETDRTVAYINLGSTWVYYFGSMSGTLSPDDKPGDLGVDDAGFKFRSTDYLHIYNWNGAAWEFALEDDGSAYFLQAPQDPAKGLWAPCDGVATDYADASGSIVGFTPPDIEGQTAYLRGIAAYTGTIVAAGDIVTLTTGVEAVNRLGVRTYFRR